MCDSKSTHSQLFPMTIPPELCNLLLCWSSCDLPRYLAVSQGHRSLQLEKRSHIPATSQQCPSHWNAPSALAGFYRLIRAVLMNRFLCIWPQGFLISDTCTLADFVECIQGEVSSLPGQPLPRGHTANPCLCLGQFRKFSSGSRMPQGGNTGAGHSLPKMTERQETWQLEHLPQSSLSVKYF